MSNTRFGILLGSVILLQILGFGALFVFKPGAAAGFDPGADKRMDFANALLAREMASQAVREFESILADYRLSSEKTANVHYTIGTTQMDNLHDWEGALYHFMVVKQYFPPQPYDGELNRRIVACLEALNRPIDAQNMMEKFTSLNTPKAGPADRGEAIAVIGTRQITRSEVEGWIRTLPGPYQNQFRGPMGFYQAVQNYIGQELLYDTAKRKGFDQDKTMSDQLNSVKRSIMMHRLYEEEIGKNLTITDMDLQNFFKSNKDRYATGKDGKKTDVQFQQVRSQVENDYRSQKEMEGQQVLFQRAMQAEHVQIFNDKLGIGIDKEAMTREAGSTPPSQGRRGGKMPEGVRVR
jgi:hypothetical protein